MRGSNSDQHAEKSCPTTESRLTTNSYVRSSGFLRTAYRHTLPSWASSPSLVAHEHSQASRWEASHGSGGGPAPTSHHRPAIQQPAERRNRAVFDTPTRYKKEGLRPRFRRSEALSRTWWQVKDSNHRSFRDGFTDQRRQARDQRKRPSHRQPTCAFPTDTRRPSATAGHPDGQRLRQRRTRSLPQRLPRQCTGVPPAHCQAQGRVRYTYFSDNRTTFLACPDAERPKCSVQFVGSKPNNILPTPTTGVLH